MKIKNISFDKKLILLIVSLLVLLSISALMYFIFNKAEKIQPKNVYKGSTFEIGVPSGWSVATSSVYKDFTVISENKRLRATKDVFKINEPMIFVMSIEAGTTTLPEAILKMRTRLTPISLQGSAVNYKILEEDRNIIVAENTPAFIIETSFETIKPRSIEEIVENKIEDSSKNDPEIAKYRNLSLITIKDSKMYIVTATTPESQWADFSGKFKDLLINFKP